MPVPGTITLENGVKKDITIFYHGYGMCIRSDQVYIFVHFLFNFIYFAMNYFTRKFSAVLAMAACVMAAGTSCNDDDAEKPKPDPVPVLTLSAPTVGRTGIAIAVEVKYAAEFSYAVLYHDPASETTDAPVPADTDYKKMQVSALTDGLLQIPASELIEYGTYSVYAFAENQTGTSKTAHVTALYDQSAFEPLVAFEVKNLTAYSLDVAVTMAEGCEKYVATLMREEVYTEAQFIESALLSIDPSESQQQYGRQPYLVNTTDATLSEARLSKDTAYGSDECAGIKLDGQSDNEAVKYLVAIYAVDKTGRGSVYTSAEPFVLPLPAFGTAPVMHINPTTTFTTVTGEFTAEGDCAKLIYGFTSVSDPELWADKEWAADYLSKLPISSVPVPYTGEPVVRKLPIQGDPGNQFAVYSMGITSDGQIGPISYEIATLKLPVLDGAATVDMEFLSATTSTLSWKVNPSPNATNVRILVSSKYYFNLDDQTLAWIMSTDETDNGYGWWEEFTIAELAAMDNTYTIEPGMPAGQTTCVVRAIAQDGDGKWGEIGVFPDQDLLTEEIEDRNYDFTKGTGEATFNILSTKPSEGMEDDALDLTYTVSKGANTQQLYRIQFSEDGDFVKVADFTFENLKAACQSRFDKDSDKDLFRIEANTEYTATTLFLPSNWGTSFIVILTEDAAGEFKIAAVYIPGQNEPLYPAAN